MSALNPVTVAVISGALVVGGKWARGQTPTMDNAIGIAGIALGLSVLEQMNEQFAAAFSTLILVSLTIAHLPAIVKGTGLSKERPIQGPGIPR